MTPKQRVALLFGGRSAEHEVSCLSAASVHAAIDTDRYEVISVGIDKRGGWHVLPAPPAPKPGNNELPEVDSEGAEVALSGNPGSPELIRKNGEREPVDVVFPVLHGPYGEDGTIQGLLEFADIPYVGAGVLASAVGMDKAVQKALFVSERLPVLRHQVVMEQGWREDPEAVLAAVEALGYPVFVKPANLGSSVGISKVKAPGDLGSALEVAFGHGPKAMVEEAAEGAREIECAVLGNDDPVASVPGEIIPTGEFYDYRSKYLEERTRLVIPAPLSADVTERIQQLAVAAFRAIDCAGMARVDFFYREPDDVIVNELNTIPGFTSVSMYPKMWEASGLPYRGLVDRLIQLGLERHGRRSRAIQRPPGAEEPAK
jgi:D-alanine-D-alanine ligase